MADKDAIKFGVDIDTKSAKESLDSLRKKLQEAAGVKLNGAGLSSLKTGLDGLKKKAVELSDALKKAAGPSLAAFTRAMKTAFLAVSAAAAAAGAAIAAALGAGLKKGIENNGALEDLQSSLTATVSALYDLRDASGAPAAGIERFEQAAAAAQERLALLRKETAETGYALEERGKALNYGLGLGAAAGLDADAVQALVRDITIASTAVGVAGEGLINEVKALFAGQGLEESQLARALAINPETLQTWRVQGTLAKELSDRLSGLKETALAADQGMNQLGGRLASNVSNALTAATAGAYETIKASLKKALDTLFSEDGEVATRYKSLYDWAVRLFDGLASAFSAGVESAVSGLGIVADWVRENESVIDGIVKSFSGMATSIVGIAKPLKDTGAALFNAQGIADGLRIAFELAERAVAALADTAAVAFGTVKIGVATILQGLSDLGSLGGKIPGLDGLGAAAEKLGKSARDMAMSGAELVKSGLTLERSIKVAGELSKRERERIGAVLKSMQVPGDAPGDAANAPQAPRNTRAKPEASAALRKQAEAAAKALQDAYDRAQATITSAQEAADKQRAASSFALAQANIDREAQLGLKTRREVIDARLALEKKALDEERKAAEASQARLSAALKKATGDEAKAALKAQLIAIDEQLKGITDKQRIVEIKAELEVAGLEGEIKALKEQLESELQGLQGKADDALSKRDSSLRNPLVNGNDELKKLIDDIYREETTQRAFEQQIENIARIRQAQADAEAAIAEQYAASQITTIQREEGLNAVREEGVAKLREAAAAMAELAASSGNVKLTEEVAELNKELDSTGERISEINKRVVDELKNDFQSTFKDIATGAKTFSDALLGLFTTLLGRIADEFAKRSFESMFASAGGAGAGSGLLGTFLSFFGGVQKKATGGSVVGAGTGTSDSIPTMLSNGEFVVRASSARKYLSLLNYLNQNGTLPSAGAAGKIPREMGGLGQLQNTVNVSPQVVIQTSQLLDALRGDSAFERTLVQIVGANKTRLGIR